MLGHAVPVLEQRAPQRIAAALIDGNVEALDAVLADPRVARPDAVVGSGDAVPGPFARPTLERLEALSSSLSVAAASKQ